MSIVRLLDILIGYHEEPSINCYIYKMNRLSKRIFKKPDLLF